MWGVQGTEVSRVFGYYEGVPIETIWWPAGFWGGFGRRACFRRAIDLG